MDPFSQAALGAVVAQASAQHKIGFRVVVAGALAGASPDIDVFFADDYFPRVSENHVHTEHHPRTALAKQTRPKELSQHKTQSPWNRRKPGAPLKVKGGCDAARPHHHILIAAQSGCILGDRLMCF